MRRKIKADNLQDESTLQVRPFPFYGMIICGLILIVIGLYLFVTNHVAHGVNWRRHTVSYNGANGYIILNGLTVMIFGLPFLITGAYFLIFKHKHVKRKKQIRRSANPIN